MTPSDFNLASSAEIMQALGQRLREQRLAKLMTQEELSRRAGVALGAVKKLESSGKVTLETLVQVARVLGLVNELSGLFAVPAYASIADMERHAAPKRQRARKRASGRGAMKKLDVFFGGWGQRWLLGTLADDGQLPTWRAPV